MMDTPLFRSRLLWSGLSSFVLIGAAGALYGPALPELARGHGISIAQAGLIVSAHGGGGLAGLLLSARFGAVSGRQSLALVLIGAGLIALSAGWAVTLLGALILGAGYALVSAVLNRRFLTEMGTRGPAMVSLLNAVFGLGAIGGPLLLLALGGSPSFTFGILALAAFLLIPFSSAEAPSAPAPMRLADLARAPGLLALGTLGVGFEASAVGFGPAALAARGLDEATAATLASAFFAAFLVARLSLMWLAGRFAPLVLLCAAFALNAVLALIAVLAPPALFFVLIGAGAGMLFPAYFLAAAQHLGHSGQAAAMILAAAYLGAITMPTLVSGLIGITNATVLFPTLAGLGLLGALGTAQMMRAHRGHP